ncbi:MAG: TrkH family potassium uptake protein [Verrucomicrobia bacterium]|nr:TrkH family potassium uptake protein [Verrucomicrobiota bacterium]
MNYRLLSKLLGLLLLLLGSAMLLCLAYAWWDQEWQDGLDAVEGFIASVAAVTVAGAILLRLGRGSGREILRKEGIAVVGVGWLMCATFGALPYLLCPPGLNPVEAFFESMSGFTTTGSTVIVDLRQCPPSLLLWRALTQWLGGLGILVLFVALLSTLGVGSKALFHHESSAKTGGGVQARIQDVAMRLWEIYLGLSVACFAGLMALGMNVFDALCHSMTALSTGGFSTRNESIAAFGSTSIELWLTLFMLLGGWNFMLYAWLLRGRWARWVAEEEGKVYLAVLLGVTAFVAANLVLVKGGYSWSAGFRHASFQVVSLMTTTGFGTADFDQWPPLSRLLLLLIMAVGGCAGSTAGGIKLARWILFLKIIRHEIVRAFRPNQVFSLRLNGNPADDVMKVQTVFFVALAGVTVCAGTVLVSLMEPALGMDSGLSAVMATLFNVGPGLGAVGPASNFAGLHPGTLLLLSLFMLLGRLEFFAVLVLFMPSLWRKY